MKILPDYLIQIMPAIESAIEELRLSVIDHAYDLLKCLDIDELSYNEIREKLRLYDLTVENMTEEWLPNGRFYRMYPSIKHHRTRQNTISSIVKSGGQFEGLWNTDFYKSIPNVYSKIQLVRHYDLGSNADGYFLVSGDTQMSADGHVISSALTALSSDILLSQALPAGYTYLYVPWPRPVYPGESGYFYNVHMLDYDRLHYAKDCNYPYNSHDEDYPASMKYDWKNGTDTPYRLPYWFDYHYMENMTYKEDGTSWPIVEKIERYYTVTNNSIETTDPEHATHFLSSHPILYDLDLVTKSYVGSNDNNEAVAIEEPCQCKDPSSVTLASFPTPCYLHTRIRSSAPDRAQDFTPYSIESWIEIESFDDDRRQDILNKLEILLGLEHHKSNDILDWVARRYDKHEDLEKPDSIFDSGNSNSNIDYIDFIDFKNNRIILPKTRDYSVAYIKAELQKVGCIVRSNSIDENCFIYPGFAYSIKSGAYRFDFLAIEYSSNEKYRIGHVKTYRPVWTESSPIFAMMQSDYMTEGFEDISSHSLRYWAELKQSKNIILPKESTIKENKPAISSITHTSFDRPTINHELIYVGYTIPKTRGNNQGKVNDNLSNDDITENEIYFLDESSSIDYNPDYYYTLVTLCHREQDDSIIYDAYDQSCSIYLEGDPYAKKLYVNVNGDTTRPDNDYSYVSYRVSKLHQLWFSPTKENVSLLSGDTANVLYNIKGSNDLYHYSFNGTGFKYYIKGVFDENRRRIDYGNAYMKCTLDFGVYKLMLYGVPENVTASYILFAVESFPGAVDEISNTVISRNIVINNAEVAAFKVDLGTISCDVEPENVGLTAFSSSSFAIDDDISSFEEQFPDAKTVFNLIYPENV